MNQQVFEQTSTPSLHINVHINYYEKGTSDATCKVLINSVNYKLQ